MFEPKHIDVQIILYLSENAVPIEADETAVHDRIRRSIVAAIKAGKPGFTYVKDFLIEKLDPLSTSLLNAAFEQRMRENHREGHPDPHAEVAEWLRALADDNAEARDPESE